MRQQPASAAAAANMKQRPNHDPSTQHFAFQSSQSVIPFCFCMEYLPLR